MHNLPNNTGLYATLYCIVRSTDYQCAYRRSMGATGHCVDGAVESPWGVGWWGGEDKLFWYIGRYTLYQ